MTNFYMLIDLEQNALSPNYFVYEQGVPHSLPRNTMPSLMRPGDTLSFFFKQGLPVAEVEMRSWPVELGNMAVLSTEYRNEAEAPEGYLAPAHFFNARVLTCAADAGYFRFALVGRYRLREPGDGEAGALSFPFMVDQECLIRVGK
ncbi:hypothetical protein HSX11_02180 [Oxalobacteraceae bacterium]|nr:hypothetical protein [Oxalobacteraceae bacterium]